MVTLYNVYSFHVGDFPKKTVAFSVGRVENGVNAAAAFVCGAEALRVSRHT